MLMIRHFFLALLIASVPIVQGAYAQESNLLPKYGSLPKNEAQKAADEKFFATIDEQYKGNRKKAAEDLSMRPLCQCD
jgi:hypothetical protein